MVKKNSAETETLPTVKIKEAYAKAGGKDWVPTSAEKTAIATEAAGMVNVPTKTSDLTNDSGFLTAHQDISGKENTANKVTSVSSSSTNTQYPSALAVYNAIQTAIGGVENGSY